ESVRPSGLVLWERYARRFAIIYVQVVSRSVIGGIEYLLQIQGHLAVLRIEGNGYHRQCVCQEYSPDIALRPLLRSGDVNDVVVASRQARHDGFTRSQEINLHPMGG